jgi:hypothetical protein
MTDTPPPTDSPWFEPIEPAEPAEPPAPPKKNRTNAIIIGAAAAVIAAVVATGIVVVQTSNHDDSKPASTTTSSTPDAIAADATEDTEPAYTPLDTDSFTIKLKTKSRHCFGSAGCNVTVEPDLALDVVSSMVDPDAVYEITYEIHGDESGPVIETAELTNQTSLSYRPSMISTSSSGTKLSVEITGVTAQG